MALSSKDKKQISRQRREAAKEAQKYHKEQQKRAKKSSDKVKKSSKNTNQPASKPKKKPSASKIEEAVNSGNTAKFQKMSREEKFRRESEQRIRNLKPRDFEDGYYIDEFSEKQRSEKRARVIRKQEREVIKRSKKPLTQRQIRLRRIIISASIILAVLIAGVVLSLTVLFKTEKIEVEGCTVYYDDQIAGFSGITLQQNIFIAKLKSTPEKISENLPYVEKAEIGVSIPDTVVIKITEAQPAYVVRKGANLLLISAKGRILEESTDNPNSLPELKCGDFSASAAGEYIEFADPAVPDILLNVAETIKESEITGIVGFDVSDTSAITLNYSNRILINIGVAEDIDYKLKTANAIITRKLEPNGATDVFGVLDVSTCSKNKMSHYKPSDTRPAPEPTTVPATEPTTAPAESYDYSGGYDYSYDYSGEADAYSYSDGTSYDDGYDYSSGGETYDYGYSDGTDYGTYDYSAGDYSYYDDSAAQNGGATWTPEG